MSDSTSTICATAAAAAATDSPPLSDPPLSSPPLNSLVATPSPLNSPQPGRPCYRNRRGPTPALSTTTAPTPADVNTKSSTAIKTTDHSHPNNTGAGTHAPLAPYHSDSKAATTAHVTSPAAEETVAKAVRRRHRPAWNSFHPADPEDARRVDRLMDREAIAWGLDRMNKAREFLGVSFSPYSVDLWYRG